MRVARNPEKEMEASVAKYRNGINGSFHGKVGTVVGVSWRGVDYFRSLPGKSNQQPTEKQLRQRKLLSDVSSWLRSIREVITIGYQQFTEGPTPMNMAISNLMKHAIKVDEGVKGIDYTRAVISRGELLSSWFATPAAAGGAALFLSWANYRPSAFNADDDLITVVVYNTAKEKFVTFHEVACRKDREALLQLPGSFTGDAVHLYVLFVAAAGDAVSTSNYLGELTIL
ncbi:DUF6266 family protein [Pedobacter faecalis]|uniref:DUF6266 family protein n=1 Tax=Pedobacter faecalis TaxID=3041495 RepID=UPI00254CE525|nr:DUF6266 family protein [Pedobacter sp. ELA7]